MKFTLSWLFEHFDTTASLEQISETLTRIGLEVEHVDNKASALTGFIVAEILETERHPNADRLQVCKVNIGTHEPVQVVCGAPNARAGLRTVFAPPGTTIPSSGTTLVVGNIRGVESRGMLCSASELMLPNESEGILELSNDAPVGDNYALYAGLDDPLIEINLTPNRADCTSIHGIARDLAASGLGALKHHQIKPIRAEAPCSVQVIRELGPWDLKLCPAFALREIKGVKNGPSPDWLQKRLSSIGLRPINALVDVTNFLTFDRGRPLHVFDAAKVKGNLVVRLAKTGESLVALDGRTYALDEDILIIADDNGPQSIAGIMGGMSAGCDEHTTDVLVECALWDPLHIARMGRKLGIHSDARYRFERGVDPDFVFAGLDLASQMILDLCGGVPSQLTLEGDIPDTSRAIHFSWHEVKRLSGLDVSRAESKVFLQQLGFHISGTVDRVKISPPSWRGDIEGKADLVEEIIRMVGLDNIESIPLPPLETSLTGGTLTLSQKRTRQAKRVLAARGMMEAITWSFISHDDANLFGGGDKKLSLSNPIASDLSDMRPSLLPGLIKAVGRNHDRGFGDVALFEVGQAFVTDEPEGQTIKAAGIRKGLAKAQQTGRNWNHDKNPADVFDIKADVFSLLTQLGIAVQNVQVVPKGPDFLHPGRSGTLQLGPKNVLGFFGEVHPAILKALDVKGPMVVFELDLDALPLPKAKATRMKPKLALSELQPLTRDFAFVVNRDVMAGDVLKAVNGAERVLISDVALFDVYEGKGLEDNQKSLAVSVTLQPRDKTLTDAEIETVSAKIVADVAKKTGAVLRG